MNPIPGRQYTVIQGDNLELISIKAYGNGERWPVIFRANQMVLKSTDKKFVQEGTKINIPRLPEFEALRDAQTR